MTLTYLTRDNNTDVNNCQHITVNQRVGTSICNENAVAAHRRIVDICRKSSWSESHYFDILVHLLCGLVHHADSNVDTVVKMRIIMYVTKCSACQPILGKLYNLIGCLHLPSMLEITYSLSYFYCYWYTGWWYSTVVASFVARTKLLNVEPG